MHSLPVSVPARREHSRAIYGLLFAILAAILAFMVMSQKANGWPVLFGLVAPDSALPLGMAPGLAKGQVHPRSVPLYNALHRFAGPCLLGAIALTWLGTPWLMGALAWGAHIALDRSLGIGLRNREGFIGD